jgi:hypothetical protein
MDIQQMILDEVRGLRKHVRDTSKNYENRLATVETKLDPLVSDAKFQRRMRVPGHVLTIGIVGAIRFIWPPHVPLPSILATY